jgi:hypothetical protein
MGAFRYIRIATKSTGSTRAGQTPSRMQSSISANWRAVISLPCPVADRMIGILGYHCGLSLRLFFSRGKTSRGASDSVYIWRKGGRSWIECLNFFTNLSRTPKSGSKSSDRLLKITNSLSNSLRERT